MLSTFFVVTGAWGVIDTQLSDCGVQWCWLLVTAMLRRIGAATKCVQLSASYSVTTHVCGLPGVSAQCACQVWDHNVSMVVWFCVLLLYMSPSKPATVCLDLRPALTRGGQKFSSIFFAALLHGAMVAGCHLHGTNT
jgi:hypothetical protein